MFIRRIFGRAQPQLPWNNRESIREELFSVERLEEHAKSLAIALPVVLGPF
jgi:cyclic beta-1,2-glucan synthetase